MALGLSPTEIIDKGEYPLLVKAEHWVRIPLSEIATVQNGFAFKSEFFNRDSGMPLIRIRDVTKSDPEHKYNGDFEPEFIVKSGDILIGMDGDFHAARWNGPDGLLNQRVCRLEVVSDHYDQKFFFLCLQPYLNAINAETSSVTVKHLSSRTIQDIPLPLPPLNEQKRIVAKIEELFSELDSGIESLQTARAQLKVYRQAVLKYAFEGKLTGAWREKNKNKLESADQLLARIKRERDECYKQELKEYSIALKNWERNEGATKKPFKPNKPSSINKIPDEKLAELSPLPLGWAWFQISDLCDVVRGGSPRPAGDPQYYDGNIPFLKVADITRNPGIYLDSYTYTIKPAGLAKTRLITPKKLLLSNSGATLGVPKICLIEATFNDGIAAFLGLEDNLLIYHYYFWLSKTGELRAINQGAAQPNLNTDIIKEFFIPISSSEEMVLVAEEIEMKLSVCDQLEQEIDVNLQKSEALRQSILKKAFSGQLVAQDAKDEPASALLARIRAEKAIVAPATKKSRTFQRTAKDFIMKNLLEALSQETGWVSVPEICKKCGIGTGSTTDEIEVFYQQLRDYLLERSVLIERRGENDWLKFNRSKAA